MADSPSSTIPQQPSADQAQDASEVSGGVYSPRTAGRSSRMIGEVVVDLGFADRETVEEAVAAARAQGRPTGLVLVERGVLRHDQLARVVAERFGLDFVDLSVYDLDMGAVNLISAKTAKRYQAVPVGFTDDGALLLAMANPTNVLTIDDVGDDDRPAHTAGCGVGRGPQPAARATRAHGRVDRGPRRRGRRRGRGQRPRWSTRPKTTRRSSSWCTRSSPRRSSRAPPTSTSTPRRATRACSAGSTACSRPRPRSSAGWPSASYRGSRSWPTSTSPRSACLRTGASRSPSTDAAWTSAS